MKVSIDIECTPEEARKFLGLPDVLAIQDILLDRLKQHIVSTPSAVDSQVLLQSIWPLQGKVLETFQQAMWSPLFTQQGTTKKEEGSE